MPRIGPRGKSFFDCQLEGETGKNLIPAREEYNLIFLDPPYNKNYVERSLASLLKNNYLSKETIIAIEMSKYEKLSQLEKFIQVKEKIYGNNKLLILKTR